jgi:hypothetical protein
VYGFTKLKKRPEPNRGYTCIAIDGCISIVGLQSDRKQKLDSLITNGGEYVYVKFCGKCRLSFSGLNVIMH